MMNQIWSQDRVCWRLATSSCLLVSLIKSRHRSGSVLGSRLRIPGAMGHALLSLGQQCCKDVLVPELLGHQQGHHHA